MSMMQPGQDGFGTDVGIQTMSPNNLQILGRAQFNSEAWCLGDKTRRYFTIYENSVEKNHPIVCCCFPGNCCCPGEDHIYKFFYDRGPYDQQDCHWKVGCKKGAPSMFAGEVQFVCCCQDCPQCYNNFAACMSSCYCPCFCGDRLRFLPSEYVCCCIPTRSNCCCNCCGMCGPKDGQPLCLHPVEICLKIGTAGDVVVAMENGRSSWRQRTGKN